MKKLIALLMATFMVLSLCAVCAVADEEYVKVAVSHQDCYSWTCGRDAMIITSGKITDITFGTSYVGASWYVYVIENIDGVYTATRCLTDNTEIGETSAPAGGFLLCIDSSAHQYETLKDSLVGYTFYDNDNVIAEGKATSGLATADDEDGEPVYIYAKAPAKLPTATIEMKDFFISHYNDSYVEGAGVVMTETYSGAGWWIHVSFKPVEGKTGVYEVVETSNGLADGSGTALAIPEGGFVYAANTGNDYPALGMEGEDYTNDAVNASIELVKTMTVGSQWIFEGLDLEGKTIPTTTPDTNWYDDGYVCTAKIGAYVEGAVIPGDDEPETVKETITVDGDLTDTGWNAKGWTTVKPGEGGTWQNEPTEGVTDTISYKYQIRKDDTKLYIAVIYDGEAVKMAAGSTSANGEGTNFRFWIHNGDTEATVYTHFIDACLCEDGKTGSMMKINTSKDSNAAGDAITDSSLTAVVTEKDGKTYCELSIDLADLGIVEGATASVIPCISNKFESGNLCLFEGNVPKPEEGATYTTNFPYHHWYGSEAVELTSDMDLGEITPDQPQTGDNGIVALVILAVVAMFGSAIVVKSRH